MLICYKLYMAKTEQLFSLEKISNEGDIRHFKILISQYNSTLLHLAYSITGRMNEAEEIVADVFMKLWERRSKLTEIDNFHFYIYRLTRNLSLDYLRKYHRVVNFTFDEIHIPFCQLVITPENLLISSEIVKKINAVINELPPKCKLIFKLVKEDGLKHKEVSNLLNISVKTVEAQMSIALKRIHASLRMYLPEYAG